MALNLLDESTTFQQFKNKPTSKYGLTYSRSIFVRTSKNVDYFDNVYFEFYYEFTTLDGT